MRRIQQSLHTTPQMLSNDDGILVRCSDVDTLPLDFLGGLTLKEANEIVLSDLTTSPLFVSQFRQNAARALLMPRAAPGKRTPLWLQRLRAGDLLQIARQFDDFPIVIETVREVLSDVLDFEHFQHIIGGIEDGSIGIRSVQTEVPSPFATSMLFDFVSVYMYEPDQSREDRRSQYLSLNRELLSEAVDIASSEPFIRPEAVDSVEKQLQRTAGGHQARSAEELLEFLLRIGDLTDAEIAERCLGDGVRFISELASNGRAIRTPLGKEERWVAGEERTMYDIIGNDGACSRIVLRYLQSHGPVTTEIVAERYALGRERAERVLTHLSSTEPVIRGHFDRRADQLQWCYRPNLERIQRHTIGILRREIKPSTLVEFTRFLFTWQHLEADHQLSGSQGVQDCLVQLQGLPLPSEIWERDILRSRVRGYSQELLNQSGAFVWTGQSAGKTRCFVRGEGHTFMEPSAHETELSLSTGSRRILDYVQAHGASFLTDIRSGTQLSLDALNRSIAELFWAGIITNDVHAELQKVRQGRSGTNLPPDRIEILDPRHNPGRPGLMRKARMALKNVPGWAGRWSLVRLPGVMGQHMNDQQRARRQAVQLLDRYGIVARELYRREELLPWALIASEFQRMEMRGEIRRGYFVEGLSGMQFGLPSAVEELRRLHSGASSASAPLLVNACDPANPFGPGIPLPQEASAGEPRLVRVPSNYVVFQRGTPLLFVENYGMRLWTLAEATEENMKNSLLIFLGVLQLPEHIRPVKAVRVEHCDGIRPAQHRLEPVLRDLGFTRDRNQTMVYERYV